MSKKNAPLTFQSIPPGILELMAKSVSKKSEEEEVEEEFIPHVMPWFQGGQQLDNNGIFIINDDITKESLAHITQKMILLHFDQSFQDCIQIILNSPGGHTDAGWAFIDIMNFVSNPIRTIALGSICSMATNIFIAGDERIMSPNSQSMIHQFSTVSMGDYPALIAGRKAEDMEYNREIQHFIRYSKYKTETEIRKHFFLDNDNWMNPEEMKKHGLCDHIIPFKDKKCLSNKSKRPSRKKS